MTPYSPSAGTDGSHGSPALPRRLRLSPGQVANDLAAEREGVVVVEGVVIGHAREGGVDLGAAELLGRHLLAGRRLHERRAAEEDRAGAPDDDRLVGHRRDIGATRRAGAHHQRDLRDPARRQLGLVVEDAAEVVAVGKDLVLQRQERAAAVHQVEARQRVLQGDLLCAQVLLHRHRVVRAALDRRVVGDDDALDALHATDAGHDPRPWRLVVVKAVRRQRVQLEERAARVEEPIDPLADRQLAALPVAGDGALVAAGAACAAASVLARRSSTRPCIAASFARNASEAGSMLERRTAMVRRLSPHGRRASVRRA